MGEVIGSGTALRFNADIDEELAPELKAFLVEKEEMTVLRHPFVCEILPIGGLANRQNRRKRTLLKDARYAKAYPRIISMSDPFDLMS